MWLCRWQAADDVIISHQTCKQCLMMLYNTWLAKIFVSVHQPSSLWTSALISGGNNLLVYKCIIIFFICETLKVRSTWKQYEAWCMRRHEKAWKGKGIFSEYCTTSVACLYTRVMTWSWSPSSGSVWRHGGDHRPLQSAWEPRPRPWELVSSVYTRQLFSQISSRVDK